MPDDDNGDFDFSQFLNPEAARPPTMWTGTSQSIRDDLILATLDPDMGRYQPTPPIAVSPAVYEALRKEAEGG